MKKGYYYTRWPDKNPKNYWRFCKGYTNVYMDWELGKRTPMLIGKKMWVDIGMYKNDKLPNPLYPESEEYVTKVLTALKPKWRKIIALELGDELKWPLRKINAKVVMVKKVMAKLGLEPKPLGITFHRDQIFEGENWKANLDYLGLEAYLDYIPGELPLQAAERMESYIKSLLDRVGPKKKLILVDQAYNRNGTWKSVDSLVAIQEPTFRAAKALGDRLIMLSMFAFARAKVTRLPDGTMSPPISTIDIPALHAEIKKLCRLY